MLVYLTSVCLMLVCPTLVFPLLVCLMLMSHTGVPHAGVPHACNVVCSSLNLSRLAGCAILSIAGDAVVAHIPIPPLLNPCVPAVRHF